MSDLEEINMKAVGAEVAHQESVLKTAQGSAIAADVIFFVIGAITIIMVIKSVAAPIHAIIKNLNEISEGIRNNHGDLSTMRL